MNTFEYFYNQELSEIKKHTINDSEFVSQLNECKDMSCVCICRDFIKEWQTIYSKQRLEISDIVDKLSRVRIIHTVSCFLLGVTLYKRSENINKEINKAIDKLENNHSMMDERYTDSFYFAWMLICIYHDFGYLYEEDQEPLGNDMLQKFFEKPMSFVSEIFTKDVICSYSEYRQCQFQVHDHGIYGACKLYEDLQSLKKYTFEKYYRMAAETIMCHNIFYCKSDNSHVACYQHKGMESLISDGKEREYKTHPFLFLLSLVDNIEPTKRFESTSVLNSITMNINKNRNIITIALSEGLDAEKSDKYMESLIAMDDWLTDVSQKKDSTCITISV